MDDHYAEAMNLSRSQPTHHMRQIVTRILVDERGASLVEYGLLVILIAIIAIAAINLTGNEVSESFRNVASELR